MPELIPYALTDLAHVNALLGFTTGDDTGRDQMISDIIGQMTDFIEGYCGGRRFLSTAYTETINIERSTYLFLSQRPATAIASVKYRTGQPSSPTWVEYYADGYLAYLGSGMIRFFSKFTQFPQAFQVQYTAGYLINWAQYNDPTQHTLPRDLTFACSQFAARTYKLSFSIGVSSESTEGQSIEYQSDRLKSALDDTIINVLRKYTMYRSAVAV
jgi:hypothetical protein